jgi:hypothetical protein
VLACEGCVSLGGVLHERRGFRVAAPSAWPLIVQAGEEFSESFRALETSPPIAWSVIVVLWHGGTS